MNIYIVQDAASKGADRYFCRKIGNIYIIIGAAADAKAVKAKKQAYTKASKASVMFVPMKIPNTNICQAVPIAQAGVLQQQSTEYGGHA